MLFGGDKLYQLPSVTPLQCMGFVLAGTGDVVVIDGGTKAETDQLEQLLLSLGGRVTGWYLTHAHFDHIQSLIEILNRGRISVGFVCYRFPARDYVERVERRDGRVACVRELEEALARTKVPVVVPQKGEPIPAGHFSALPLSDGNALGEDLNCSSVVYRLSTRGEPILFLGDMGVAGEARLMEEFPEEIRCPVVQMAHHGQQGVDGDFYRAVRPKVCLWPTPLWLWNNDIGQGFDTGPYKTLETRGWIAELGCENVHAYDSITELE